jgi:SAM-dependent methyltransferase
VSGELDKAFWEDHYHGSGGHREGRPSPQLVSELADLTPGTALEAGCGEGANAVWLAEHGWQVTAVDISATALRRARAHADSLGVDVSGRISWVEADLTAAPPAAAGFDLVTAHYLHPVAPFAQMVRLLADAVAPTGTLLVVGHDPADAHSSAHAPAEVSFSAEELAAGLDASCWEVEVAETRTRDDATHDTTFHDAVLRAKRRS